MVTLVSFTKVCVAPVRPFKEVMPVPAKACETQVVPFDVKTFPDVPGVTNVGEEIPLPRITPFAVRVANPVPPRATSIAVPFQTPLVIVPTPASDERVVTEGVT